MFINYIKHHSQEELMMFAMNYAKKYIKNICFLNGFTECRCCHKLMAYDGELSESFYDVVSSYNHNEYRGIICENCFSEDEDYISSQAGEPLRVADNIDIDD